MPLLFPTQGTLHDVFHTSMPFGQAAPQQVGVKRTSQQARSELYTAWSVVDDAKNKANALSAEATKEFEKASSKAQAKAGKIELYSAKYYAACTFGGLLACVSEITQILEEIYLQWARVLHIPLSRHWT
jgi:solute carrier family 25 phosphate transporter 3